MNNRSENSVIGNLWIKVGFLIGAFLFAYWRVLSLLVKVWDRPDYSHGFLVPIIALYFVWTDKKRLKGLPVQPNIPGGIILIVISSFLLAIGNINGVSIIQELSLVLIIPGLVLMNMGTSYLKALFLPLAYLILMVPILDDVIEKIHWPFQLFTAIVSAKLLTIFGVPLFRNAQYIQLPSMTMEVAEACSGIRYLISIIAIAIPLAYFTQKGWQRRSFLIILALLIGIVTNWMRVTLIGIWVYYYGESDIHGPLHIFQGVFVSVVGFILLFIFAWFLSKARLTSKGNS